MVGSQMVRVPSRGYIQCVTLTFSVTLLYVLVHIAYKWHELTASGYHICICIYDIYNMGVGFKIAHEGAIVCIYNIVSIAYVCVCFFNKLTLSFPNLKFLPEFLSFHLSFHFSF